MKRNVSLLVAAVALIAGLALPLAAEDQQEQPVDAEVVFVLDTTGSMSGLIEGAKQKIWSIAGGIIQRTGGKVRIGLVPYRDRGDVYVTKVFPLTDNLDQVYADLQGFRAEGGGDTPESVNQALYEAVAQIQWSDSLRVMRTIFLVGDCPPHMDYEDDVKYPASCAMAARKNIVVNTVQCGGDSATVPHWQKIARLTNGGYTRIGQSGDMKMVETPFDREIQQINIEISRTILPYGAAPTQSSMRKRVRLNVAAAPSVAAERNAVKAESFAASDLAAPVGGQDLTAEPEKLAELKAEELPEEMQSMTPAERQARLEKAVEQRKALNAQLVELNAKRAAYLLEAEKSRTEGSAPAGFDAEVLKSVDAQLQQLRSGATLEAK